MGKEQAQLFDGKALKGRKPRCPVCTLPMRCPCKGGVIIGSPRTDAWQRGLSKTLRRRLDERGLLTTGNYSEAFAWAFTDDAPPPSDARIAPLVADIKRIYPTPRKLRALVNQAIVEGRAWDAKAAERDAEWAAKTAAWDARDKERRAARATGRAPEHGRTPAFSANLARYAAMEPIYTTRGGKLVLIADVEREEGIALREKIVALMPRIDVDEAAIEAEAEAERRALADIDDEAEAQAAAEAQAEREERRDWLRHLAAR